jgi:hypothetical protein
MESCSSQESDCNIRHCPDENGWRDTPGVYCYCAEFGGQPTTIGVHPIVKARALCANDGWVASTSSGSGGALNQQPSPEADSPSQSSENPPTSDDSAAAQSSDEQPSAGDDSAQQSNPTDEQSQENERATEREQEFEAQQAQGSNSPDSASQNESADNARDSSADSSILTASAQDQQPEVFKEEYASAIASAQTDQPQPANLSEPMDNVVQLASNSASSGGAAAEQVPENPVWNEASGEVSGDSNSSASAGSAYNTLQSFGKDIVANVQAQLPSSVLDYEAEGILPDPVEMTQSAIQDTIQDRVQAAIPQSDDQTDSVDAMSGQIDSTFGRDLMVQLTKNGAGLSPLNDAKAVWNYLSNIVQLELFNKGTAQVQEPLGGSTDDQ